MKKLILLVVLLALPLSAFALSYEVIGGCSERPVFSGTFDPSPEGMNVGAASLAIFKQDHIPYRGSESGFSSILGTPDGKEAIEILSDREMRAFGWCYEVDGKQPDLMPDEFSLEGAQRLRWFFAFSHYKDGQWVSYCEPAYTLQRASFCTP